MSGDDLLPGILTGMQAQLIAQTTELAKLSAGVADLKPTIQDHEERLREAMREHATHQEVQAVESSTKNQLDRIEGKVDRLDQRVEKIEHSAAQSVHVWVKKFWATTQNRVLTTVALAVAAVISGIILTWLHLH